MENKQETLAAQETREAPVKVKHPWTENAVVAYWMTFVLVLVGQLVGGLALGFIPFLWSTPALSTATMYFECFGMWLVGAGYMALVKKDRPILRSLGPAGRGNNWRMLLLGFALGGGMNGVCILAAFLHGDLALSFACFEPGWLLLIFVGVFVQSSAEEMLCRGFLYGRLLRRYKNPLVAILGNSALFAVLHLLNDGVTVLSIINIFLVGVFFSLLVYYFDSIWCAMAAHAAWNFTQNIIFGLPNSGLLAPYSIFMNDNAASRDSFAYNVGFGVEATVVSAVLFLLASALVIALGRFHSVKKRK